MCQLRIHLLVAPMTLNIGVNVLHDLGGDSAADHNLQCRHDHYESKFGVIYKDMSVRTK